MIECSLAVDTSKYPANNFRRNSFSTQLLLIIVIYVQVGKLVQGKTSPPNLRGSVTTNTKQDFHIVFQVFFKINQYAASNVKGRLNYLITKFNLVKTSIYKSDISFKVLIHDITLNFNIVEMA